MQVSAILHALVGSMKISQCKANDRGALTCRNHGRASPKVGRGGGTGERPITSLQGQKRLRGWLGCSRLDWAGCSESGLLGRARSGFGVAPWALEKSLLGRARGAPPPPRNFWNFFWVVEPQPGSLPRQRPYPSRHSTLQHIQVYNYTPDSLLWSPPPSLFPCVLTLAFVLDTLHSVAD